MKKKFFEKIKLLIRSFILTVVYFFKACFSHQNTKDGNNDFVVSLTTFGWRYNFVFFTIESILSQTIKPAKIYLWIYKNDKPFILSKWILARQKKRGLVIIYVDRDVRSYKKLSFILSEKNISFSHVVTADDDVFYPNNWLSGFVKHPDVSSSVLCYRGRVITFKLDGEKLASYKDWPLASESDNFENNILPTGVSGICYPIAALDGRIADFEKIEALCPYADDIWYKLLTTSNGYRSVILKGKDNHYPPVITSLTKGLEKLNVNEDRNIEQFISSSIYFNVENNHFKNKCR